MTADAEIRPGMGGAWVMTSGERRHRWPAVGALIGLVVTTALAVPAQADEPENQIPGGNPNTTITVTPGHGLRAGQEVEVTGAGYNSGFTVGTFTICTTTVPAVCSDEIGDFVTIEGTFSQFVRVPARFDPAGPAGEINCRLTQCVLVARDSAHVASHSLSFGPYRLPADFNDDGMGDISVFRPSNGLWFIRGGNPEVVAWGTAGDKAVPYDFDGDGDSEIAVFRPDSGFWFIRGGPTLAFGTSGDIPVPADYDGNGTVDIAVFRPSNGIWFVQGGPTVVFGTNGDIPVPADYDGDGTADIAVFRPSNGIWFIQDGETRAFGTSGDIPVPGDYEDPADGRANLAVFRPPSGTWLFRDHSPAAVAWGTNGDIPVPNSFDIDADTDIAVFRPSTGVWFFWVIADPVAWGTSGDVPLPRANPSL